MTTSLRLDTVRLIRLPGIDDGFTVSELSPGLNLVYGPNASGKSSLVRAMDAVLWPTADTRPAFSVSGRFCVGDVRWQVAIDAGSVQAFANGAPARALTLPAPAMRHRYVLSLHDLLAAANGDGGFAREIALASTGGLDVAAAATKMGASDRAIRTSGPRRAYEEALAAVRDETARQAALFTRSTQLEARRAERDTAAEGARLLGLIDAALDYHKRCAHRETLQRELAQFPDVVQTLAGDEHTQAKALLDRWTHTHTEWLDASRALDAAQRARDTEFACTPPSRAEQETWRGLVAELRRCTDARDRALIECVDARARRDETRRQLGAAHRTELPTADREVIERLAIFAERFELARLQLSVAAAARGAEASIDGDPGERETSSAESLRDALRLLVRWLAADAQESARRQARGPTPVILLAAIAVAASALLAWRWHPLALLGAVLATIVCVWILRREATGADTSSPAYARDFAALGVPVPAEWCAECVVSHLHTLTQRLIAAEHRATARERQQAAERAHEQAAAGFARVEQEAIDLQAELGVAPGAHPRTIAWVLERLHRWQDAQAEVMAAEAVCEGQQQRLQDTCASLVSALRQHGVLSEVPETVHSVAALDALVADVAVRAERWQAAQTTSESCTARRAQLEVMLGDLTAAWFALCTRAGIDAPALTSADGGDACGRVLRALGALVDQRRECDRLVVAIRDADRDVYAIVSRVGGTLPDAAVGTATDQSRTPPDSSNGITLPPAFAALLTNTPDQLRERRAQAETLAERHVALVSEVATLEHQLTVARGAHDLESALARRDAALAALESQRDEQIDALLAHALSQHLLTSTRDVHRPAVFHRARSLFAQITRGRWVLHLDDQGDVAKFRAEDTRTMRSFALDQLSSGTRVQLLVAVRVAFVENSEHDVRLPLFFDETLGTSDDERAAALIEAVLALVREGRQVFYLTAQHDEVDKWRAALGDSDVAWRELDLVAVRRLSAVARRRGRAAPAPHVLRTPLPDLAGRDHESYGLALAVPAIHPGVTPLGQTHLWYVLESLPVLHAALQAGIETWGELEWYLASGGALAVEQLAPEAVRASLSAARSDAELLAVLHEQSAIGLGRPVDRATLLATGVVTAKFLPEIAKLAQKCSGDALMLLQELDNGGVRGFGATRISQLRDALQQSENLNTDLSLSGEAIRLAMVARASGPDPASRVDALLKRLRAIAIGSGHEVPAPTS